MISNEIKLSIDKLVLGTAQFSKGYGITNKKSTNNEEIKKILNYAKDISLKRIDTATSYGDSEKLIGEYNNSEFLISTKVLCPNKISNFDKDTFSKKFDNSLNKSKTKNFETLFVHNANEFINDKKKVFFSHLQELKESGKIKKIGVSVYEPQEVYKLIELYNIDTIQIPLNLFDQRFLENEIYNFIQNSNIEVHIRSVFLQGILLSEFSELPKSFYQWKDYFKYYDDWVKLNKINKITACLNFVYDKFKDSLIIIGVNSLDNLKQIIENYIRFSLINSESLKVKNSKLTDPRKWKI